MRSFLYAFFNSYKTDDSSTKIAIYLIIFAFLTIMSDAEIFTVEKLPFVDIKIGNNTAAISSLVSFSLSLALLVVAVKVNLQQQRDAVVEAINSIPDGPEGLHEDDIRRHFLANLDSLDRMSRIRSIAECTTLFVIPMLLGIRVTVSHFIDILNILKELL